MLPGGPLSKQQLTKLKLYSGTVHPHDVQKPKIIDFDKLNKKNLVKLMENLNTAEIKIKKSNLILKIANMLQEEEKDQ